VRERYKRDRDSEIVRERNERERERGRDRDTEIVRERGERERERERVRERIREILCVSM